MVGFDLDMTLIDTVPGFTATLEMLGSELGVVFPAEQMTARLGPQIPMGRSYERRELFGGEETTSERPHAAMVVKEAVGGRARAGERIALSEVKLPSWAARGARVIAEFEDGSAAALLNKHGRGKVVTIVPDAWTAEAQRMALAARRRAKRDSISGETF